MSNKKSLGASKPMGQNMIPKIGYGYICLREGEEGRAKDMLYWLIFVINTIYTYIFSIYIF